MKKVLKIVLIVIGVIFLIGIISSIFEKKEPAVFAKENDYAAITDSIVRADSLANENLRRDLETKELENWNYSEETDNMTDKQIFFAQCNANNQFNFEFPYEGGSTLSILVRKMNGKNEVLLQISKGQFNSPYNSAVSIKFDDGNILKYGFDNAADGSNNYIFLNSPQTIIKKLKAAKKVKIEAPFFQEGKQVAEFDVDGLKWEH